MVTSCPCCSRERDSFVCKGCLTKLLKLYKFQASSHDSLLPAAQARALKGIQAATKTRQAEALHADTTKRIQAVKTECLRLKAYTEEVQSRGKQRRQALAARAACLAAAKEAVQHAASITYVGTLMQNPNALPSMDTLKQQQARQRQGLSELANELASTRHILLHELLEAFEVTGCPSFGCRYQIACLPVPPLPHLQEIPKQQFNAIISLLLSLVKLTARYLGIQLPFPPFGSPCKPLIQALPRTMNSYRYPKVYPLYMTSTSSSANPLSSMKPAPSSSADTATATAANHVVALKIGLHMLAFDAYYIHQTTQNFIHAAHVRPAVESKVEDHVDLTDVLWLLINASRSNSFGRLSHVKTAGADPLRNVESLAGYLEFSSYYHQCTEKQEKLQSQGSVDLQRTTKRKGTYVVVTAGEPLLVPRKEPEEIQQANRDEEGWSMV